MQRPSRNLEDEEDVGESFKHLASLSHGDLSRMLRIPWRGPSRTNVMHRNISSSSLFSTTSTVHHHLASPRNSRPASPTARTSSPSASSSSKPRRRACPSVQESRIPATSSSLCRADNTSSSSLSQSGNSASRHSSRPCSRPGSPTASVLSLKARKGPLNPMTLLTFTTPDGDPFAEDIPQHLLARIDQAKCKACNENMSPSATRTIQNGIVTSLPEVPVTEKRKPFLQDGHDSPLTHTGTARANIAATYERPDGTTEKGYASRHAGQTVLQQHISFWDTDNDGVIWPLDTYHGFRALGYSLFISILSTLIINLNFSYATLPHGRFLPDPLFRIYTANIHKDKHGSDSGTYDTEGRFVPQKFEDIFSKYGGTTDGNKDGLTFWETTDYMKGQRVVFDFFGWGGAAFEWLATWLLLWPEEGFFVGKIRKEDIRGIYDGSLFFDIAQRRKAGKVSKKGH